MKVKNESRFHIKSLNQEKLFNSIYKDFPISRIERINEKEVSFSCPFSEHKKLKKILNDKHIEILSIKHFGVLSNFSKLFASVGGILAGVLIVVFLAVQSQFIWQYEVLGTNVLEKKEIVSFIKQNFNKKKTSLKTRAVEISLLNGFDEISFVSCMIKGQTLVVNIKEKLLPDEKYGQFKPIVSNKNAKIKEIELVSGTLKVKAGDVVKVGDVLVEPYVVDSSGELMKVEAKAKFIAEVYNEGSSEHCDNVVETYRTGEVCEESIVTLFGLEIYKFKTEKKFEKFEVEYEESDLSNNNILPFKLKKTKYFEVKERVVQTNFEDVKDEYIEKAKANALKNCENCDNIIDEYYTLRHLSGVTIVNFCIVTQEEIGVQNVD